jgi:hypothetical protein
MRRERATVWSTTSFDEEANAKGQRKEEEARVMRGQEGDDDDGKAGGGGMGGRGMKSLLR